MALQKPIVGTIPAFDAADEQIIPFTVNSGDQVVQNRAVIRLGSTNEIVYDDTQTTFALSHTIPAETLTNGNYYTIQIQTFNASEGESALSSPITFYCYSTPTFEFANIPDGGIISNASFNFELSYNQAEGEAINSWIINVYNSNLKLLWSSGVNYAGANGVPPTAFNFNVAGFEDSTIYYVQASGQTDQLTILDTGYEVLQVVYDSPSIYTQMSLTNNACGGYIIIDSNVISLDGTSNPDPPIYIDNEAIDLTGSEAYVNWEQSFAIYDISTTRIWLRDINPNSIIATFYNASDANQNITLYEREATEDDVEYIYIEGYYTGSDGTTGYIYSEPINKPDANTTCMVWLQKNGGMYDLSIEALS